MKNKISILLFLTINLISCQERYKNESIFLGEYNENEAKIFKIDTDSIVFLDKQSLTQENQLNPVNFFKFLTDKNLYFIAEGDEPYWKLKLNSSNLYFVKFDSIKEEHISCEIYYDNQSGFKIMFKSIDNRVFGLIRRVDSRLEPNRACSIAVTENYLVYEAFITIENVLYKGCATIDKE
ncbi:hypothetical protein [Cellulophaga sp. HaHa_2_1]|uniref:hypothetical protein n=1 Tax=Cellulophaga sp. HaHa_2_1 TaxID=2749994 RepID=UPI001C4FA4D2|nr:hypothetical protein [Cellulophaga sp. HaHa_2_1]QXP52393.1 hypothetical protein H0I24_00250 [Cellulophaga sp. HaHa_2_1]